MSTNARKMEQEFVPQHMHLHFVFSSNKEQYNDLVQMLTVFPVVEVRLYLYLGFISYRFKHLHELAVTEGFNSSVITYRSDTALRFLELQLQSIRYQCSCCLLLFRIT